MKLRYIRTDLKYVKANEWELLEPIYYRDITVPIGFRTDLATIPRILWPIFPPYGTYLRAAIVHDYLYISKQKSKRVADGIFKDIMLEDDVPLVQAYLFYSAVRLFGVY